MRINEALKYCQVFSSEHMDMNARTKELKESLEAWHVRLRDNLSCGIEGMQDKGRMLMPFVLRSPKGRKKTRLKTGV